jgi:aminoglycoside 6'-N-acetyltransferase
MIKAQSAPASAPIRYGLRAMGPTDLPIVRGWLGEAHVTRWWPDPERGLRSIGRHLGEPGIECFIRTIDCRDAGYLQVYDPHHGPKTGVHAQTSIHPAGDQPRGARGIDPFIGEARFIGGHRPRLMRRILDRLFEGEMRCVLTDPDPMNTRSVAASHRAGFRGVGERGTAWGVCSSCAATITNQ